MQQKGKTLKITLRLTLRIIKKNFQDEELPRKLFITTR